MKVKINANLLLFITLALTAAPIDASAQPYSELIVFGGNFEDSGNDAIESPSIFGFSVPPSPPYFEGRFSNGPTWVDTLADHFGMPRPEPSLAGGTNYAYGGAATGSWPNDLEQFGVLNVDDQVAEYLDEQVPTGAELFFVPGWTASVDFSDGQTDINESAMFVGQAISDLASAGASQVIVMNYPSGNRIDTSELRVSYNDRLSEEIETQRRSHSGLTIYELDAEQVITSVLEDPTAFGIRFVEGEACADCGAGLTPTPTEIAENPNEYLYWDRVGDFTAPLHKLLGDSAYQLFVADVAGDFDEDGNLEPADLDLLANAIRESSSDAEFDLNGDGRVDETDYNFFVADIVGTTVGDTNLDGLTDFVDFLALSTNFGGDGGWGEGNFGLDTTVEFDDFLALSANFGMAPSMGELANVPEPRSTANLILVCFVTGMLFRGSGRRWLNKRCAP